MEQSLNIATPTSVELNGNSYLGIPNVLHPPDMLKILWCGKQCTVNNQKVYPVAVNLPSGYDVEYCDRYNTVNYKNLQKRSSNQYYPLLDEWLGESSPHQTRIILYGKKQRMDDFVMYSITSGCEYKITFKVTEASGHKSQLYSKQCPIASLLPTLELEPINLKSKLIYGNLKVI